MLTVIAEVVRACSVILHGPEAAAARRAPEIKGERTDFVTVCDRRMQQSLFDRLAAAFPNARFMGEEDDAHVTDLAGDVFIIDPIDGTTNFIRDMNTSAVSVGLLRDGVPHIGVIYDPYGDRMYTAEAGKGAFCNGVRLSVSSVSLSDSIVAFGTAPYYKSELASPTMEAARRVFERCLDIRRSGSAAIDLANLAAGRTDAFFEWRLSPWDYAAGAVLVSEAGGSITQPDGSPLRFNTPCGVCAGNPAAAAELREILQGI